MAAIEPFTRIFALDLPYGHCVGVSLPSVDGGAGDVPEPALARLHEDERRHAATLGAVRRTTWVGGRLALRAALADLSIDAAAGPILETARRAPRLPDGVTASISHKDGLAVALAAPLELARAGWRVGVDVERLAPRAVDISRHVLRPEEIERLPATEARRHAAILAAFSAKEAIYKALDPFVGRYVSFHEVAVAHDGDPMDAAPGAIRAARAAMHLGPRGCGPAEGPFEVELVWLRRDDVIVSAARVRLQAASALC